MACRPNLAHGIVFVSKVLLWNTAMLIYSDAVHGRFCVARQSCVIETKVISLAKPKIFTLCFFDVKKNFAELWSR